MIFGSILALGTFGAWVAGRKSTGWATHFRRGLAAAMVVAGVAHIAGSEPFVQHLPGWAPLREPIVFVAGVDVDGQPGGAYPWVRLPLQVVFVALALWSTRGAASHADDRTLPASAAIAR